MELETVFKENLGLPPRSAQSRPAVGAQGVSWAGHKIQVLGTPGKEKLKLQDLTQPLAES